MTRYDVIVAGAGPAGSTAARVCAAQGLNTLLLDRVEFPRDKPCGGAVNLRTVRLLPFDIAPVVERPIRGMRISVNGGSAFTRYRDEPISFLTQRRLLDAFLVERAVDSGARLCQRTPVSGVERHGQWLTVRSGSQTFETRMLVAADGANGPTARLAGLTVARTNEIALEGNITPAATLPDEWRDVFGIDVGSVPGGYGWLFPKGNHVNVGVGGYASIGPTLRSRLDAAARSYQLDPASLWGVRGHPLPVRRPGGVLVEGNVILVGDAAGLLDPLTGEGIYAAVWSGMSAAHRITAVLNNRAANLDPYRWDVERELEPDLATSRQLHVLFHLAPHAWASFVRRSPRAWRLLCGLITGELTYSRVRQRSHLLSRAIDTTYGGVMATRAISEQDFGLIGRHIHRLMARRA